MTVLRNRPAFHQQFCGGDRRAGQTGIREASPQRAGSEPKGSIGPGTHYEVGVMQSLVVGSRELIAIALPRISHVYLGIIITISVLLFLSTPYHSDIFGLLWTWTCFTVIRSPRPSPGFPS